MPRLIFSMLLLMSVRCVEQHFAEDILDVVVHVSQTSQDEMIEEGKRGEGERFKAAT